MQQYFVNCTENDDYALITGDDYHHIKNVMRMKIDDELLIANKNKVYYATITEINNDYVKVKILYQIKENRELDVAVTIAQGMPKQDKFEYIIQKTTELGIRELIPVFSERSLIKLDNKKQEQKLERYRKIAKSAAEQSHRQIIPEIKSFMDMKEFINYSKQFQYKCLAYEGSIEAEKFNLYNILSKLKKDDKILFFIGPEGGVSEKELALLKENDFIITSLGNRILRTETAPLFVMSVITYERELKG